MTPPVASSLASLQPPLSNSRHARDTPHPSLAAHHVSPNGRLAVFRAHRFDQPPRMDRLPVARAIRSTLSRNRPSQCPVHPNWGSTFKQDCPKPQRSSSTGRPIRAPFRKSAPSKQRFRLSRHTHPRKPPTRHRPRPRRLPPRTRTRSPRSPHAHCPTLPHPTRGLLRTLPCIRRHSLAHHRSTLENVGRQRPTPPFHTPSAHPSAKPLRRNRRPRPRAQ
ncbi:MAG: hypothetical protein RIS92_91 [Verrucomicrobiota bacterium]